MLNSHLISLLCLDNLLTFPYALSLNMNSKLKHLSICRLRLIFRKLSQLHDWENTLYLEESLHYFMVFGYLYWLCSLSLMNVVHRSSVNCWIICTNLFLPFIKKYYFTGKWNWIVKKFEFCILVFLVAILIYSKS